MKTRHRGPLRATLEGRWSLRDGSERADIAIAFSVDAHSSVVRLDVTGTHDVLDHRMRLGIASGVADGVVFADAMFGPVRRDPIVVSDDDARMERPPTTQPLHRYVSAFAGETGATLISDGLAECEVTPDGVMFVTLVRAVGELSRNDIPERNGHAGWPTATPEAQCRGPFAARLGFLLHGARTTATIDAIERAADDLLLPITGRTRRSTLAIAREARGPALHGEGLACSAITTSDDGEWLVLRCVNLLDAPAAGRWELPFTPREARFARLDETPLQPAPIDGSGVPFSCGPRAVTTLLVR